jgi:anti-sigma-K factor RskA
MDKQIEVLLPFYVLDALSDEERKLVESYLAENPKARKQIEKMSGAVSSLPYSMSPVEPPKRVKDALMARVAADADARARASKQNQPSGPRVMRLANIFQVFSMGVATVAIVWAVILNTQLAQLRNEVSTLREAADAQANSLEQINQLRNEVSLLGEALIAQSNSLEQINAKLTQITPAGAVTISLKGTDVQPDAHGQLIADPNSNSGVLVIAGLGQLEPGKTYQVWLIDGGGPKSAGLLTIDENGQGVLVVTSELTIAEFNALGISIEPDGGSPQPTGDIVVLSEL